MPRIGFKVCVKNASSPVPEFVDDTIHMTKWDAEKAKEALIRVWDETKKHQLEVREIVDDE